MHQQQRMLEMTERLRGEGEAYAVATVVRSVNLTSAKPGAKAIISRDGEIAGWKHRLEGANLEEIAPNFYRLSVPNDSFATVTTIIEAIEPKRFAVSLHGGVSIPHGSFGRAFDPGFGAR